MILYTPLSETDIYPTDQSSYENRQTINVHGRMLHVERLENGTYKIVQLLSTDPQDFLNMSFNPGQIISENS